MVKGPCGNGTECVSTIGLVRSHVWKLLEEVQGVMDMRSWE